MKNKKFTYLLIFSTVAVWSLILMRIYESTKDSDSALPSHAPQFSGPLHIEQHLNDRYTLTLKRDPFAPSEYAMSIATETSDVDPIKIPVSTPLMPAKLAWPKLSYNGYINNPNSKKKVAIIQFGETQQYLDEGDTYQGVKLIKNATDSIQVSYQKETRYFKLN